MHHLIGHMVGYPSPSPDMGPGYPTPLDLGTAPPPLLLTSGGHQVITGNLLGCVHIDRD